MTNYSIFATIHRLCSDSPGGLDGWCPAEKGLWLAEVILLTRPTLVVEIGVYGGRSFIPMALAMQQVNSTRTQKGIVLGIDPYSADANIEGIPESDQAWAKNLDYGAVRDTCLSAIELLNVNDSCELLQKHSHECSAGYEPASIDLLHIDGCHSKFASCRDVSDWLPLVRPDGIVVFDDTDWSTLRAALSMVRSQCHLIHIGSVGRWEAYRKSGG